MFFSAETVKQQNPQWMKNYSNCGSENVRIEEGIETPVAWNDELKEPVLVLQYLRTALL
jgi:hypothetical protein